MLLKDQKDLSKLYRSVEVFMASDRYDAAEKILRQALADYGTLAQLHNLLGLVFHKQGKFRDAMNEFHVAHRSNPLFLEASLNLIVCCCDLGLYDEAAILSEEIGRNREQPTKIQSMPTLVLGRLANLHAQNGRAYEEVGLYLEAIQEFKKALHIYDNMPDVRLQLGKLYFYLGQNDKALFEFEEIRRTNTDAVDAKIWLGILSFKAGNIAATKNYWNARELMDEEGNIITNPALKALESYVQSLSS